MEIGRMRWTNIERKSKNFALWFRRIESVDHRSRIAMTNDTITTA